MWTWLVSEGKSLHMRVGSELHTWTFSPHANVIFFLSSPCGHKRSVYSPSFHVRVTMTTVITALAYFA